MEMFRVEFNKCLKDVCVTESELILKIKTELNEFYDTGICILLFKYYNNSTTGVYEEMRLVDANENNTDARRSEYIIGILNKDSITDSEFKLFNDLSNYEDLISKSDDTKSHGDGEFNFKSVKNQSYYFDRINKESFYAFYYSYDDLKLYDSTFIKSLYNTSDDNGKYQNSDKPIRFDYVTDNTVTPYYQIIINKTPFFDSKFKISDDDYVRVLKLVPESNTEKVFQTVNITKQLDARLSTNFNFKTIINTYLFNNADTDNFNIRMKITNIIRPKVFSQFKVFIDKCMEKFKENNNQILSQDTNDQTSNYIICENIGNINQIIDIDENENSLKIQPNVNKLQETFITTFKHEFDKLVNDKKFTPVIKPMGDVSVNIEDYKSKNKEYIKSKITNIDPKNHDPTIMSIKSLFFNPHPNGPADNFFNKFINSKLDTMFNENIKNNYIPVGYVEIKNTEDKPSYSFLVFLTSDNKFTINPMDHMYKIDDVIDYDEEKSYNKEELSKDLDIKIETVNKIVDEINVSINKKGSINNIDFNKDLKFYTYIIQQSTSSKSMVSRISSIFNTKTGGRRTRRKGKSFANKKSKRRYKV
jgi:hypothetical protein